MKNSTLPTEAKVVEYLLDHPNFLGEHPEVMVEIIVPHRCGTAVSLIEHQLSILRDQNQQLKRRLRELIDNARDNEALLQRLIEFSMMLNECRHIEEVVHCINSSIQDQFDVEHSAVRIFGEFRLIVSEEFVAFDEQVRGLFGHVFVRGGPVCGRLQRAQLDYLFGDVQQDIASGALLPLGPKGEFGLLALGSCDPQRFHPAQATDFLRQFSELVASAIAPHMEVA